MYLLHDMLQLLILVQFILKNNSEFCLSLFYVYFYHYQFLLYLLDLNSEIKSK